MLRRESTMFEFCGNLHVHSTLSDGHGTHTQIAEAAVQAALDFVVVTDHNLRPEGLDGYRFVGERRVLMLIGEEIHNPNRSPEKSHLLVYEARREMAEFGTDPQALIEQIGSHGGLSFLAHPFDCAAPRFRQGDLSWDDWQVEGYTGLELWNFMVDFKCRLRSLPAAVFYSYFPSQIAQGPRRRALALWDSLLASGKRVVAIGNSDAHALPARLGPLRRTLFPYLWLFRAVNTHVLTEQALSGEPEADRAMLFQSIRQGRCFIGYDLPADSRGFMFSGQSERGTAVMGDALTFELGATLQVRSPAPGRIRILRAGSVHHEWLASQHAVLTITEPGPYRAEVQLPRGGRFRPWIYSNPIFVQRI